VSTPGGLPLTDEAAAPPPAEVAAPAEAQPAGPQPGWHRALDTALRVAGGLVAVVATAATAVIEIFFAPLRVGGVLVGASVLLAVVANIALVRFTVAATGTRWAAAGPAVIWFALMIVASGKRHEGDLLLAAGNWVGLTMIFAGTGAFAIAGYRLILPPGLAHRPPTG
jgi:hypothetical protein